MNQFRDKIQIKAKATGIPVDQMLSFPLPLTINPFSPARRIKSNSATRLSNISIQWQDD